MFARFHTLPNRSDDCRGSFCNWSWELTGLVLLLILHPIAAPDYWWQLARGRVICEGHFAPSQALLAYELNSDADWLGGLPWYWLHTIAGPSSVSIALALAAVFLANSIVKRHGSHSRTSQIQIAIVFLGFAAARSAWSPTPAIVDVCAMTGMWTFAGRLSRRVRPLTVIQLLLCEVIWANMATLPILGLLVTFVRLNQCRGDQSTPLSVRQQVRLFVLIALCGSVTPRGLYSLWDSFRVLFPWISADISTLVAAELLPSFSWPPSPEFVAFATLCGFNLYLLNRKLVTGKGPSWQDFGIVMMTIMIAGSSTANLGPASVLLMLWAMELSRSEPQCDPAGELIRPFPGFGYVLAIALVAGATTVASGVGSGEQSPLGWGLSPQLEPTLLEHALNGVKLGGTAYCHGAREAGLLAWLHPGEIQPADFPRHALLSGRLQSHIRIGWDLAHGWTDQHRRSDGSWGGWLIPLRERDTRLILIPADELAMIRTLESSALKPLAIDAPCIPYGSLNEPALARQIGKTQALLALIENGEWTYSPPPAAGTGDHFDFRGWMTGKHDLRIDLRQARTLAAMNRNTAALKVLAHSLRAGDEAARSEFCAIQLSLAYREAQATGHATSWHICTYLDSGGLIATLSRVDPGLDMALSTLPKGFLHAVSAYTRNDLDSAKRTLSDADVESLYALSQIALEEGNPRKAERYFQQLVSKYPNSPEAESVFHASVQQSE